MYVHVGKASLIAKVCNLGQLAVLIFVQSFQTDEIILLKMHFVLLEFGEGYFVKGLRSVSDNFLLKRRKLSLFPFHQHF